MSFPSSWTSRQKNKPIRLPFRPPFGGRIFFGCVIGAGSVIGAGALVREGQVIPPRSVVVGVPGKAVRTVSDGQFGEIRRSAARYIELAEKYKI